MTAVPVFVAYRCCNCGRESDIPAQVSNRQLQATHEHKDGNEWRCDLIVEPTDTASEGEK